ncbi:hypothetical protein P3W45_001449 [Vairimorpha bombi]|jgi:serine/threonine protein kinase
MKISNSLPQSPVLFAEGSYGKLYLTYDCLTNKLILIKHIKNTNALNEAYIQSRISHPLIIKLYWVKILNDHELILGLEYFNNLSLEDYIQHKEIFTEKSIFKIFRQLVDVTRYLHSINIVHGDIKTDNILVDSDFNIKLCDFGFSKEIQKGDMIKDLRGSLFYYPPELIHKKIYDGKKADIWCLGIVLYTLICGNPPSRDDKLSVIFSSKIKNNSELYTMILGMLNPEFKQRWGLEEIDVCKWYKNMKEKYKK